MPFVTGYVKVRAWVPPGRPDFPPGFPETGLPGFPDQGLPPEVSPPWVPDVPGIGGGPILPGRPSLPDWERPDVPVYPVTEPGDIGGHGDLPDLNATRRIAVSDGDNVFPAYAVVSGDSEEPRYPSRGEPGTWVTVAYHGAVVWAWSPTLTLPERPTFGRPDQGLPGESR